MTIKLFPNRWDTRHCGYGRDDIPGLFKFSSTAFFHPGRLFLEIDPIPRGPEEEDDEKTFRGPTRAS